MLGGADEASAAVDPQRNLTARRFRNGAFTIRRLYVAWGHHDGLHLVGPRRHFHIFVWTRGHRRNPIYVSLRSST